MGDVVECGEVLNNPTISVIMAAYNAESYIARAIKSVQAQTFPDWELICIDDGSTDGTGSVIQGLSARDSRIKLISQANAGPAEARRKGYIVGAGAYFIMLDADDWFGPDALERLLGEAKKTQADGVICRPMLLEAGNDYWFSAHERIGTTEQSELTGEQAFVRTFPWRIHGIGLYHKDIIKAVAVDPRNAFNKFNSDEYLTRKIFLQCKKVVVGSGEYFIYPNQNSITRTPSWRHFLSLETDRKLTDLAFERELSTNIIIMVLKSQRKSLRRSVVRFARHGGDGKNVMVLREIQKSTVHYINNARKVEGWPFALSIGFLIPIQALRGFAGRLWLLGNLNGKSRRQQ